MYVVDVSVYYYKMYLAIIMCIVDYIAYVLITYALFINLNVQYIFHFYCCFELILSIL